MKRMNATREDKLMMIQLLPTMPPQLYKHGNNRNNNKNDNKETLDEAPLTPCWSCEFTPHKALADCRNVIYPLNTSIQHQAITSCTANNMKERALIKFYDYSYIVCFLAGYFQISSASKMYLRDTVCLDQCMCCHTDIEATDQTCGIIWSFLLFIVWPCPTA